MQLLDLPAPLDQALGQLWGDPSERGRHIREEAAVNDAEAELVVWVSDALASS